MNYRTHLKNLFKAGYAGVFIQSYEEQRVEADLASIAKEIKFNVFVWSVTDSLLGPIEEGVVPHQMMDENGMPLGPDALLQHIEKKLPEKSIVIAKDFHLFLQDSNSVMIRKVKDALGVARNSNKRLVALGCRYLMCPELEKEFTVVEYQLPSRDELNYTLEGIAKASGIELNGDRDKVIDAASGMTTLEAGDAFALAVVETGGKEIDPAVVSREKCNVVKKQGILEIVESKVTLDDIGGLENLKTDLWEKRDLFTKEARDYGLQAPRGVLVVGQPGCLHPDTPIFDPVDQSTRSVFQRFVENKPFHVISLANGEPVVAMAHSPRKFPTSQMVKVGFSNGEAITVTLGHRFLASDGWLTCAAAVSRFLAGERVLLASVSSVDLSASLSGVRRYSQTEQGSQSDYLLLSHSHDEPLRHRSSTFQVPVPSQVDAPERIQIELRGCSLRLDAPGNAPGHIRREHLSTYRRAIDCCVDQRGGNAFQSFEATYSPLTQLSQGSQLSLAATCLKDTSHEPSDLDQGSIPKVCDAREPSPRTREHTSTRLDLKPRKGRKCHPQKHLPCEVLPRGVEANPEDVSACRVNTGTVEIVNVNYADQSEYYDFTVPETENYWAAGVFHHNTGKSLTATACGTIFNIPLVKLEAGRLFASHVGESEANWRKAFQTAKAISPCVLWIDEVDGLFSGGKSSGETDGGTTNRVLKSILQDMQFNSDGIFYFFTANDLQHLPDPLIDRLDVWSVDLPNGREREQIWKVQISKTRSGVKGRKPKAFDIPTIAKETDGYSGRQIEQIWLKALTLAYNDGKREPTDADILKAKSRFVATSITMAAQIEERKKRLQGKATPAGIPEESSQPKMRKFAD